MALCLTLSTLCCLCSVVRFLYVTLYYHVDNTLHVLSSLSSVYHFSRVRLFPLCEQQAKNKIKFTFKELFRHSLDVTPIFTHLLVLFLSAPSPTYELATC